MQPARRMLGRIRVGLLLAGTGVGLLAALGFTAAARPHARSARSVGSAAAASRPFKAHVTYEETNHGHQQGKATVGVQGHGTFSATLSPQASLEASLISAVSGVPVAKIARGGTYKVERAFLATGGISGLAVARFKAGRLGSVCVKYTQHSGKYTPGDPFVPMLGTVVTEGGTGAAAMWRVHLSYRLTSVSGLSIEKFGYGGSEHADLGKAKPMTAACKRVAAIPG